MKRYEVLGKCLSNFEDLEDYEQDTLANYINCPEDSECDFGCALNAQCIKCKTKWLLEEWK